MATKEQMKTKMEPSEMGVLRETKKLLIWYSHVQSITNEIFPKKKHHMKTERERPKKHILEEFTKSLTLKNINSVLKIFI